MRAQVSSLSLIVTVLLALHPSGCAKRSPEGPAPVPASSFITQWRADLEVERDQAKRLFVRNDLVFLYTEDNRVYTLSAAGGQLLAMSDVAPPGSELRPPVLLGDKIVFPTISTMEVYDRRGRRQASVELDRATRSPATADQNFLYIGLDYAGGGRVAKLDITRAYGRTMWEMLTMGGVVAAPAIHENVIYAASTDGKTYAFAPNRDPIWPMQGNTFVTAGPIVADLRADDFGVYVASTDSKLYCLDRSTGRIKWSYFAGQPLRTGPVVTADRVYQYVPRRGLVALNKTEGKSAREALWTAPDARKVLSLDDKYVYALHDDGAIIALDRSDGIERFRSRRDDLTITATNTSGSTIYAANERGEVLAIRPVLAPGAIGQIVLNEAAELVP